LKEDLENKYEIEKPKKQHVI